MRKLTAMFSLVLALGGAAAAQAQEATGSTTDTKSLSVTGNVPAMCAGGTITSGAGTFPLGVLIDTTTGLLRTDLAAPDKVLAGSFCSTRSTITIGATALAAQNFTSTAPSGFSRSVDYTATAQGWTVTPAAYTTGAAANAAATQTRASAFSGDITVHIGDFATTGGAALRPVADNSYLGTVTITLATAN